MKAIGLFFVLFLSVGIVSVSAKQLPLENQTPIRDFFDSWQEFLSKDTKSDYETKQEYIDRLKSFYKDLPIYFFTNENPSGKQGIYYDAEIQSVVYSGLTETLGAQIKGSCSGFDSERSMLKFTNFEDFSDYRSLKIKMEPKEAQELIANFGVIFGVKFEYSAGVEDFGEGHLSWLTPHGAAYFDKHESNYTSCFELIIEGTGKSITLFNKKTNEIVSQKHTFTDTSTVWNYTTATEEPKESSGSGGGGGCFIGVLQ